MESIIRDGSIILTVNFPNILEEVEPGKNGKRCQPIIKYGLEKT